MGCQITTPCKGTAWLVNVGATDAPYCGPFWRILFLPGTKINLKHMSKICKEEWAKITQENFNKLVNDYWNYIETVVAANVRHTYYKTLIYLLFLLFFMLLSCWLVTVWILLSLLLFTKIFVWVLLFLILLWSLYYCFLTYG